ncbi:Fe(3+) dicitrate transport protein [Fontimonas thermophila]|uniref:Fe(3+) dicitrate transport protein n=1 Tax=Fontimonas thermophila TaxID=1076937 RepID=A0A1I2JFQ1_9GAMM|nr:TonB-dependent receptor [Fontimonas thermophila]SFF51501.1 Fe(3+) dicitrate transport protein [Fontimonas thermophila]
MSLKKTYFAAACLLIGAPAMAADPPSEPIEQRAEEDNHTAAAPPGSTRLESMTVIGTPEQARALPSSHAVLDGQMLEAAHVFTTNEALRKLPGIHVRDEEGLGLRPNIGIRGLNPTRSTKVLLLEDGLPLAYAPYGDNASYYHPPIDRFDRIEVLKGSATNLYGPQTISGVINYMTPTPPERLSGLLALSGGSRDYFNGHARIGGHGLLLDAIHKRGEGARDNTESELQDYNIKGVFELESGQRLIARANHYIEDSQVTYSGLTDAEYANFGPRYNPFRNDTFDARRSGSSLTHEWAMTERAQLTTSLYYAEFARDWWRQSSTTTDTQCGTQFRDDRIAGLAVDPDSCNSRQGRLREYYTYGIEPRLRVVWGKTHELTTGLRVHAESQRRLQINGTSPTATTGTTAENNRRLTEAYSAFVQNRFAFGAAAVTPGLRVEHIRYERQNRLNGARGDTELTEPIPSLGVTYDFAGAYTLYAGVHRGFAPPRVEDILTNTGTAVDLEAEDSRNYELGLRGRPWRGISFDATGFINDFGRQIAVGSIAAGGVPLATGEAAYRGAELLARIDLGHLLDSAHNPFFELAYTWLPEADAQSAFVRVDNGTPVNGSAPGRRMPYAPKHLLTANLGYAHPLGLDARLEAQYIGEQFADFANSPNPDGTGQNGRIPGATVWNAAATYTMPSRNWSVFIAAKNLFDKTYIVDRTRGILPGQPRLVHGGVSYRFE